MTHTPDPTGAVAPGGYPINEAEDLAFVADVRIGQHNPALRATFWTLLPERCTLSALTCSAARGAGRDALLLHGYKLVDAGVFHRPPSDRCDCRW